MAKGIAHREWVLYRSDYKTEAEFWRAVTEEAVANTHMMNRLGVAIVNAPMRRESGGEWFTEGVVFQTASVPGVRDDETLTEEPVDLADLAGVGGSE